MKDPFAKAEVVKLNRFQEEIKNNSSALVELSRYKLNEPNEAEWQKIREKIAAVIFKKIEKEALSKLAQQEGFSIRPRTNRVFFKLKVMVGNSQLVGVSKTLYHLLPDLIPPIDRRHTLEKYFEKRGVGADREALLFLEILDEFHSICKDFNLTDMDCKNWNFTVVDNVGEFDTSIPKLIDNAIIGLKKGA